MTEQTTFVYVVVPVGVAAQNTAGVFETRELAEEAAKDLWRDTDGYHALRVEERVVGKVYDTFMRRRGGLQHEPLDPDPQIEFVPESGVVGR